MKERNKGLVEEARKATAVVEKLIMQSLIFIFLYIIPGKIKRKEEKLS